MTKGRTPPDQREPGVYVSNLYGYHADMPLVELEIVGHREPRVQMTIDQARSVALQLLEACEASAQDAFLIRFFRDKLELDERHAATMLMHYRKMREDMQRPANAGDQPPSA
jgi:hypothetical protein